MSDITTRRAEEIRETTGIAWEYTCLQAERERDEMQTYPGLSVHRDAQGRYFVAHGFRKAEHADPETFRVTPFYSTGEAAQRAYAEKSSEYAEHVKGYVADILRRDNITEPSGQWSAYDVARVLDPAAREPRDMFDTGPETAPTSEWVALAERTIKALGISGRYVGGTSGHLCT